MAITFLGALLSLHYWGQAYNLMIQQQYAKWRGKKVKNKKIPKNKICIYIYIMKPYILVMHKMYDKMSNKMYIQNLK